MSVTVPTANIRPEVTAELTYNGGELYKTYFINEALHFSRWQHAAYKILLLAMEYFEFVNCFS